jgi:hypothetical protein
MITTVDGLLAGMTPPNEIMKIGTTMQAAGVQHSLLYATWPTRGGRRTVAWAERHDAHHLPRPDSVHQSNGRAAVVSGIARSDGDADPRADADRSAVAQQRNRGRDDGRAGDHVLGPAVTRLERRRVRAGCMAALEVSTVTGNGAPVTTITISYTNESGTAGRTGTIASFPATAVAGTFVPFALQAGDLGIRSIQSITLGTSLVSGTVHLVVYRKLAALNLAQPNAGAPKDAIGLGFPRLYDNTVPFLVCLPNGTTAATVTGSLVVAQG